MPGVENVFATLPKRHSMAAADRPLVGIPSSHVGYAAFKRVS
jgi:hypothetical protein